MTSWTDMPLASFDLETSGIDVFTDKVVTGCIVRIDGAKASSKTWLANPGVVIPAEATAVHGVSTEHAREHGLPHDEVVAEIVDELYSCWQEGRYISCFNGSFDFSLIASNHPRFEVRGLIFDGYVVDRAMDPYRPGKRTLEAVCDHYGVRLDAAHNAEADALAAARLAWKLPRVYPTLALASPDSLMASQTDWYRERAYSYIDYLRRNHRPYDTVNTAWPIQTPPKATAA